MTQSPERSKKIEIDLDALQAELEEIAALKGYAVSTTTEDNYLRVTVSGEGVERGTRTKVIPLNFSPKTNAIEFVQNPNERK